MKQFLEDLFKGVGNKAWELGRIAAAWAIFSTSALAGFKLWQGQTLSLDDYAKAMMTVFAGCAIFIGAKDIARAQAEKADRQ